MKKISKELDDKFKKLVGLYITNGLSPAEFADNIFIDDYKEILMKKKDNQIVMEMSFVSEYHNEEIKTKLRYYYDQNKKLLMIEEKNNNQRYKKIWNREEREEELATEIAQLINDEVDQKARKYFIESLPAELKERLSGALLKVA